MTVSPQAHSELRELVALYAVGGLDNHERSRIEEHLSTCQSCVTDVEAAAVIHRIAASGTSSPSAGLRADVLASAFDARQPSTESNGAIVDGSAVAAWEAEAGRFRALLDDPRLGRRESGDVGAWDTVCSPTFGLSVRSMVCHLIASESLRARLLGVDIAGIPETASQIERRTRAVVERHSALPIAATIDEFDRVVVAMTGLLRGLDADQRQSPSVMVRGFTLDEHTALRALETWTHADDIRSALLEPETSPHEQHIGTMTSVLPQWISFALADQPHQVNQRGYRISLTGPGGRVLDIAPMQSPSIEPVVSFSCDAIEFCKLAGARRDPASLVYDAPGDPVAAGTFVHALASFELI